MKIKGEFTSKCLSKVGRRIFISIKDLGLTKRNVTKSKVSKEYWNLPGGYVLHCIKTESYIAQKSVKIHSGPDSKVMHSFTTRMHFSQSCALCNDDGYFSSPSHLACKSQICQRHSPILTLPTARVIHIPPAQHTGLSLAGWTRHSFASSRVGKGEMHRAGSTPIQINLKFVK